MGGQADGLTPPVAQAVKRADAEAPKPRRIGPLGRFHAPLKIPLRAGGVHVRINVAVVGLLIHHQPLRAGLRDRPVFLRLHRAQFQRDAGHLVGAARRTQSATIAVATRTSDARPRPGECCGIPAAAAPAPRGTLPPRVSVTRRIGLSREKPQYLQLLMHSLERYSGAKRRMTLPNRCRVMCCERCDSGSSSSAARRGDQLRKVFQAKDRLSQAGARCGGRSVPAPLQQSVQRQGIKFRNKAHQQNLATRQGMSSDVEQIGLLQAGRMIIIRIYQPPGFP